MKMSRAPYVMFADQDDKWLTNKVETSLDQLKAMERQYGSHLPLLIHTDLTVVDSKLGELASSFWKYAGLNPNQTSLNRLLSQNILTGCTMLMNRALVELANMNQTMSEPDGMEFYLSSLNLQKKCTKKPIV